MGFPMDGWRGELYPFFYFEMFFKTLQSHVAGEGWENSWVVVVVLARLYVEVVYGALKYMSASLKCVG